MAVLIWAGVLAFCGLAVWPRRFVVLSRSRRRDGTDRDRKSSQILDERLVGGDIDPKERWCLRELIGGDPTPTAAAGWR